MSLCKDFQTAPVCATDTDGVRTTYTASYEMGNNAAGESVLVATRYLDADGSVVDLAASTVTAGACPVFAPDIEWEQYCDVQADGSSIPFMCRTITSFDTSGVVIDPAKVDFFEDDKVTPYVPTGEPGPCPDCQPVVAQGVLTAWGA